jgi:hypothetical protein
MTNPEDFRLAVDSALLFSVVEKSPSDGPGTSGVPAILKDGI